MSAPVALLPPAVTALRDVVRGALPDVTAQSPDGVEVYDGPDPSRPFAPRAVTVAAAFDDEQDAITSDRVYTGLGGRYTETLAVAGSVYVGGGDIDEIETYRDEVGGILAAIAAALDADPTLAGAVARARLTSASWLQGIDENGAGVMAGFIVELVILS